MASARVRSQGTNGSREPRDYVRLRSNQPEFSNDGTLGVDDLVHGYVVAIGIELVAAAP